MYRTTTPLRKLLAPHTRSFHTHWIPPPPLPPIPICQSHPSRRYNPTITTSSPKDLFSLRASTDRLVHNNDPTQILILTHGIAGKRVRKNFPGTPGGVGVYFSRNSNLSLDLQPHSSMVGRILEDGDPMCHTYNSAQLQAVITGLGLRDWAGEGWKRVVVASCGPYVVNGISEKLVIWEENKWGNKGGVIARYRELWGELLVLLERLNEEGIDVKFWKVMKVDNPAVELAIKGQNAEKEMFIEQARKRKFEKRINREVTRVGRLLGPSSGGRPGMGVYK